MPGSTPRVAIPYPVGTDVPNIPNDMLALATRLDNLMPQRVTVLPTTGLVDGMTVDYVADNTNAVIFRLRYNAGSASAYKWERVGASPLIAEVTTTQALGVSGAYAAITGGPSLTLPLAGDWLIRHGAEIINTSFASAESTHVTVKLGAAAASNAEEIVFAHPANASGQNTSPSRSMRRNGLAASAVLAHYYTSVNGQDSILNRWIEAMPIRVG